MDEKELLRPEQAENAAATTSQSTTPAAGAGQQSEEAQPRTEAGDAVTETETTPTPNAETGTPQAETVPETAETAPEAETTAEGTADAEATEAETRPLPTTKEGIIERLKEIAHANGKAGRSEIDSLKQTYYKLHAAEVLSAREAYIAAGGTADDFLPPADPMEEEFKAELSLIKELRAKAQEELEREKQANLEKKLDIIARIKEMATSAEEADKNYDAFKKLQAEWKETGPVPPEKATELWKNHQLYVEQFYDLLRLNHEFRTYDFKKNLEAKTHLCEAAEKLAEEPDPVSAFHQLQKLHQEFREIGPVARELRDEIWNRFKAASTIVNKRHQAHFETLKAREQENLTRKTALCERVEAIDIEAPTSFAQWDALTKEILQIQAEWKTIGFTPKKMNTPIFERFRAACDRFFQAKAEHFKTLRQTLAANLQKKTALCEQAEALRDSTDWNATAAKLTALQREWKTIGPTSRKSSEAIWQRFNDACNHFFEQRNAATSGQRQEENANLEKKTALLDRFEALLDNPAQEDAATQAREIITEWNATGHVPFRKKDKLQARYRAALDRAYAEIPGLRSGSRRGQAAPTGTGLTRAYEAKKSELLSYETNLTFLRAKSASGNSLISEVEKKIERLKTELAQMGEQLEALREQPAETGNDQ